MLPIKLLIWTCKKNIVISFYWGCYWRLPFTFYPRTFYDALVWWDSILTLLNKRTTSASSPENKRFLMWSIEISSPQPFNKPLPCWPQWPKINVQCWWLFSKPVFKSSLVSKCTSFQNHFQTFSTQQLSRHSRPIVERQIDVSVQPTVSQILTVHLISM